VLLEMLFSVLISQSTTQGLQKVWRIVLLTINIKKTYEENLSLQFVNLYKITLAVSLGRNEDKWSESS